MGADSDYGALLAAYAGLQKKHRWASALKMGLTLVSAFLGAGWTARGYLEQLATKDSVAALLKGQQEQLDKHDGRLALYNDRITVVEVLCGQTHKPLEIRPLENRR